MKPIRFIAVIALFTATVTACIGKRSNPTNDSTKDTIAKAKDDSISKAPLDTTKADTVERAPTDTLDARPVH